MDGAIDVSFVVNVKGDGPGKLFTLACTGANDGDEGVITSFRLKSVSLGTDADGGVTTAPVVVQVGTVAPFDVSNLKGHSAKAFELLERAIEEHGEHPPAGSPGFPEGVTMVTRDRWRERFYADSNAKGAMITDDTLRKRFERAIEELVKIKKIGTMGQWFWLDNRTNPDMSGH